MPWKIQSVVGERWRLVRTLLQKQKSVLELSRHFGVSRKTAYKWKARFLQDGRRALRNRSRRPQRLPRQLADRWIQRIRRLRRQQYRAATSHDDAFEVIRGQITRGDVPDPGLHPLQISRQAHYRPTRSRDVQNHASSPSR